MKHRLLFFLVVNIFVLRGYSQTLTITPGIVNTSVNPDSFEVKGKATLKNTSAQTKRVVWQRNIISKPSAWQVLVCDINQCWTSGVSVSPDTIVLAPNGTSNLDVYIRPSGASGAATVELKATEVGNATNTVTGRYLFTSSTGIKEYTYKGSPSVRIYPNPTTDYFMLSDDNDVVERVIVYNIIGRQVKSYKAVNNTKYSVNDLPEGIYVIRLQNANGMTVKTIRLNKSKVKA
ncbi:MAG: T9SS type A sorting domain-containing protein [Saprospiraceae bacterium]|nr:T9SS type A sorting domain-containing protein [Saprospiraceae bacterium]